MILTKEVYYPLQGLSYIQYWVNLTVHFASVFPCYSGLWPRTKNVQASNYNKSAWCSDIIETHTLLSGLKLLYDIMN
jgi:hypothetical protein